MANKTKEQIIIRDAQGRETKFSAEYGTATIFTMQNETIIIDKKDWVAMINFINEQFEKYKGND